MPPMKKKIKRVLFIIALLWVIFLVDWYTSLHLSSWGIVPRVRSGLAGILFAPLLHLNLSHLMMNTVPLFVLSVLLLVFYEKVAVPALMIIWLAGGALVWALARPGIHVGASGIVYGMAAFLIAYGILKRNFTSFIVSLGVAVIYGGAMLSGIIPTHRPISWESHLLSAVAGTFAAFFIRRPSRR